MEIIQWIVPFFAIGMWALTQIFRYQKENQRAARQREESPVPVKPVDSVEEPTPRPRRTAEQVDKFLEEVRRRKQGTVQQQQPQPVEPPKPSPRPVQERPVPVPQRPQPVESPRTRRVQPEPVPVVVEVVEMTHKPPAGFRQPHAARKPKVAATATMTTVVKMLQDRESLAAALLLREIFDEPRSRKPHRPPQARN